ncbi:MAG TPA: dTDP-4-amino-4,6-dideoxygalactose transaminase [Flavobacteriales bacterium]|nr:dTDP-4-amino-4,6-dideoxygalactose transaminase [Flavobacteriales bacterium]
MIPLHIPYYSPTTRDAVKNVVLGLNDKNYYAELSTQFENEFGFKHSYFTKSCTSALETIALLLELKPGDEVIVPSYTFVTSANAFAMFGANIVFADSHENHPNVSVRSIVEKITPKTRAIVVVHYGGVAVEELENLRRECDKRNIFLIEDAAHAIGAYLNQKHLGLFGHAATFSFHESKNLTCVEGGLLLINHEPWCTRANYIINKGTNRAQFDSKHVAFYEWVDFGSSYKLDTLHAAILSEQLKNIREVTARRLEIYNLYENGLRPLHDKGAFYFQPHVEKAIRHNAHICWIVLPTAEEKNKLHAYLKSKEIFTTFHYLALHKSPFGKKYHNKTALPNSEKFETNLLRLPLYFQLSNNEVNYIISEIKNYYNS